MSDTESMNFGVYLPPAFFDRDTVQVARELLGQRLVRKAEGGELISARITETEAYDGFEDRASHAHRGRTPRNEVMFGPPGVIYLYLCYGVHWLLNITTRGTSYPAAVLIRGVENISGPGRVTKFFRLDGGLNRQPLGAQTGLWIEAGTPVADSSVQALPRVGVDYAGTVWRDIPWRFKAGGAR
jgi:DNA-3-methyladenine glycosylase